MSLSDKYRASIEQDKKQINEKEVFLDKLRVFENCGLGKAEVLLSFRLDTQPLPLPQKALNLIKEAIPLINDDKWNSAKMVFSNNDATFELDGKYVITYLRDCKYIKYKWPDGSMHLGRFEFEFYKSERGYFNPLKKAKSSAPRFVKEINKKRAQLAPYLIGNQRYVFLDFYFICHGDDDFTDHAELILFEDGYLFVLDGNRKEITIDDKRISSGRSLLRSCTLEDWLIRNIKKINGTNS